MIALLTSRVGLYALIVVAAIALAWGAYTYIERQGYQRGVVEWQAKYDRLVSDYAEAKAAEIERLMDANNAAKAREAQRIAELEHENEELEKLMKEQAIAAEQDPDRDRVGLGAPSVQRLNKIR